MAADASMFFRRSKTFLNGSVKKTFSTVPRSFHESMTSVCAAGQPREIKFPVCAEILHARAIRIAQQKIITDRRFGPFGVRQVKRRLPEFLVHITASAARVPAVRRQTTCDRRKETASGQNACGNAIELSFSCAGVRGARVFHPPIAPAPPPAAGKRRPPSRRRRDCRRGNFSPADQM